MSIKSQTDTVTQYYRCWDTSKHSSLVQLAWVFMLCTCQCSYLHQSQQVFSQTDSLLQGRFILNWWQGWHQKWISFDQRNIVRLRPHLFLPWQQGNLKTMTKLTSEVNKFRSKKHFMSKFKSWLPPHLFLLWKESNLKPMTRLTSKKTWNMKKRWLFQHPSLNME